ncbi:MAG: hypothetical protein ACSHXD_11415 [Marinosulfonomonas sp.]
MTLDDIDKTGLISESYKIDGISIEECRSIFVDWALKLPTEIADKDALEMLIATYGPQAPDHPMTSVLKDGLGTTARSGRRGGRKARMV